MAHYESWRIPPDFGAQTREERQGGVVRRYVPDMLCESDSSVSADTAEFVGDVSARVAAFGASIRDEHIGMLYATLLKSESISSSMIEGYQTSPRNVVLAGFDPEYSSDTARIVWNNVMAVKDSLASLNGEWIVDAIHDVHHTLLPDMPYGARTGQVRIGGSTIFKASYIAPDAALVPAYMDDLVAYANTGADTTLTKAAIVHAQFETIHPYGDGNGRTGRAIIHALLNRSGIVSNGAVLPISTVLKVRSDEYIAALTGYRYSNEDGDNRHDAVNQFVLTFAEAANDSVTLAARVRDDVAAVRRDWNEKASGIRADSVAHSILATLPESPIVTAASVEIQFGVTRLASARAIGRLEEVGILQRIEGKHRHSNAYIATDILSLMADAERRAASPDMDTVLSSPVLPVPASSHQLTLVCDAWMPNAKKNCALSKGHAGPHKSSRG
ncbi:MAG: Fic family protein [Propionibacteriaceae bacterium]|nr:Fic family protein [Propionibacteriaceae bacterium]